MPSKNSQRDDFTPAVIRKMRDRVNHRCSNPECRVPTSAPGDGKNGVNNIGVAAHIYAASPNGPRYLATMEPEQRKHFDNGVWLCANCSIKIDRSPSDYSSELLRCWKKEGERLAQEEMGKKLPSDQDAVNQLATALTGQPRKLLANAISNIHFATSKSLEELDERFNISSSYSDGIPVFDISPKSSSVSVNFKINPDKVGAFFEKQRRFVEAGKGYEISTDFISTSDSQLFDEILSKPGKMSVKGREIDAVQKIWIQCPETNIIESFDDVNGSFTAGTKEFSFEGSTFNGLFRIKNFSNLPAERVSANTSMTVHFSLWEGCDVRLLPFLGKLYNLFTKMEKGWKLHTSLELYGECLVKSEPVNIAGLDFVKDTTTFLIYCHSVKRIANATSQEIGFTSDVGFSSEELKEVVDIAELLEEPQTYAKKDLKGEASFTVKVSENENENDIFKIQEKKKEGREIAMVQQGVQVDLFNQKVDLPDEKTVLNPVKLIPDRTLGKAKPGDTVKFKCVPLDGFRLTKSFVY